MELSGEYPVKRLCRIMDVNRSGFYKWRTRIYNPSEKFQIDASQSQNEYNFTNSNDLKMSTQEFNKKKIRK